MLEMADKLLAAWRYVADVTVGGDVYNQYLDQIPIEVRDAFLTIGKWLAELLF